MLKLRLFRHRHYKLSVRSVCPSVFGRCRRLDAHGRKRGLSEVFRRRRQPLRMRKRLDVDDEGRDA